MPIGSRTEKSYWACLRQLSEHYDQSPDRLTPEQIRQYCIYLKSEKKVARQTSTQAICAIKLFWEKTLHRPWPHELELVRANPEYKLPVVLSAGEVRRILSHVPLLDQRVALITIYSCGLRLGEGLRLEIPAFGHAMPARQREVLVRILKCRTPALGGSLYVCPRCGDPHYACHSCNDRHCPRCGRTEADRWLAARQQRLLLPVPFFLVTFTVPEGLRPWFRSHPRQAYDLMFALTAQTLQDLAGNPKRFDGSLGLLGVLHTWSRTLVYHPHLHYLVPGGALTRDQRQWKPSPKKFLLPVKALGQRFRALFKKALAKHHPQALAQVPPKVWKQNWVVHTQPVGSGHQALAYLSRYLFKTATGDRPVIQRSEGKILWPYRQSRTGQLRHLPLTPFELIRRFLQHVLPRGYTRVRSFGWFHPAARIRLNRVRALLKQQPVLTPAEQQAWQGPEPWEPPETDSTPSSPTQDAGPLCRRCHVPMECQATWRPGQKTPHPWQRGPP